VNGEVLWIGNELIAGEFCGLFEGFTAGFLREKGISEQAFQQALQAGASQQAYGLRGKAEIDHNTILLGGLNILIVQSRLPK
jgi:hypothetical protein